MYYVIKKLEKSEPLQVIGFKVPKYLTNKSSDTVIFEFLVDEKIVRKWVKKKDIILLTDDKDFYLKTMREFQEIKEAQEKLVEEAKKALEQTIENYSEAMESQLENFEELRDSGDIPCILKDL